MSINIHIAVQNTFFTDPDFKCKGILKDVVSMSGHYFLSGKTVDLETFLSKTQAQVEDRLLDFLEDHPEVPSDTDKVVMLDLEYPAHPSSLFTHDAATQDLIVQAYKDRIAAVRKTFPNAKLSMYGVLVPDPEGNEEDPDQIARLAALQEAGQEGAFDGLDYISPVLYTRFGCSNSGVCDGKKWGTGPAYTQLGITASKLIKRSDNSDIDLFPILGLTVANGNSKFNDVLLIDLDIDDPLGQTLFAQIDLIEELGVQDVMVWIGGKDSNLILGPIGVKNPNSRLVSDFFCPDGVLKSPPKSKRDNYKGVPKEIPLSVGRDGKLIFHRGKSKRQKFIDDYSGAKIILQPDDRHVISNADIIQEAIDDVIEEGGKRGVGGTVILPHGLFEIDKPLKIANVYNLHIRGQGPQSTELAWTGDDPESPVVLFNKTQDCGMYELSIRATTSGAVGVRFQDDHVTPTGRPNNIRSSRGHLDNVTIFCEELLPIGVQLYNFDPDDDAKNDSHWFYRLRVIDYTDAAFELTGQASTDINLYAPMFQGREVGQVGMRIGVTNSGSYARGGSVRIFGGLCMENQVADFHFNNRTGAFICTGMFFEQSKRLLIVDDPHPSVNTHPVSFDSIRWTSSLTQIAEDGEIVQYHSNAPLSIRGSMFGLQNSFSAIKFRVEPHAGQAGFIFDGNIVNTTTSGGCFSAQPPDSFSGSMWNKGGGTSDIKPLVRCADAGTYTPVTYSDWAARGIVSPFAWWHFQEYNSETIYDYNNRTGTPHNLATVSGVTLQNTYPGWDGYWGGFNGKDGELFSLSDSAGEFDPNNNSVASMAVFRVDSVPGECSLCPMGNGSQGNPGGPVLRFNSTGRLKIWVNGVSATGSYDYRDNEEHIFAFVYDRENQLVNCYTEKETITGTYASVVGNASRKGFGAHANSIQSFTGGIRWGAWWVGPDAQTIVSGTINKLGWRSDPVQSLDNTHSLLLASGTGQYASISDGSQTGLDLTGSHSIEAWVNFTTVPSSNQTNFVAGKWGFGNNKESYALYWVRSGSNFLRARIEGTNGLQDYVQWPWTPIADTWYHLALTVDLSLTVSNGRFKMYVDGSVLGGMQINDENNVSDVKNSTAPFSIGAWFNNDVAEGFFDGRIDEVRVWSTVRTSVDIVDNKDIQLLGDEPGLVSYWALNNSYSDTTDLGNTLTPTGSPTFSTDKPF